MRAERITSTSDNCYILTETKTQNIFKQIEAIEPEIVDSIQTLHTDYIESQEVYPKFGKPRQN
jgi:DNA repair protein RadA/Sms